MNEAVISRPSLRHPGKPAYPTVEVALQAVTDALRDKQMATQAWNAAEARCHAAVRDRAQAYATLDFHAADRCRVERELALAAQFDAREAQIAAAHRATHAFDEASRLYFAADLVPANEVTIRRKTIANPATGNTARCEYLEYDQQVHVSLDGKVFDGSAWDLNDWAAGQGFVLKYQETKASFKASA